jgi:hypothetical protein
MTDIKREVKLEDGTSIKPEPDDDMDYASDVEDEDMGELQFPKNIAQNAWLMRIPKDLWAALRTLDMDDQIPVGEIWEWKDEKTGKKTVRSGTGHLVSVRVLIVTYRLDSRFNRTCRALTWSRKSTIYSPLTKSLASQQTSKTHSSFQKRTFQDFSGIRLDGASSKKGEMH